MSVLSTIKKSFSPYSFDKTNVRFEDVESAFEAARWAPSGYNNQPWRFVYTSRDHKNFEKMLSFPVDSNRKWMKDCGGIAVILAKTQSDYNGQLDPSVQYCCGLAVGQMLVEISALGLHSHQIGGFDSKELAKFLRLPNTVIPMAMMAVGRTSEEPSKNRKRKLLKVLVLR